MTAPTVTIIMTVHNRRAFVEQAVRSILTQTYTDIEFIIVDDGSTDGASDLLRTLAAQDPRINLSIQPHRGLVPTLIHANQMARGEYVGWLDGDDLLTQTAVERTAGHLAAHPDTIMVYSDLIYIDGHNRVISRSKHTLPYSPQNLLSEYMTMPFRLFRREAWQRTGGIDPTLTMAPDYDFCLKVSEIGKIDNIPEPFYCYRIHGENASSTRRIEQIANSEQAVRNALIRRGLADTFDLSVSIHSRFQLIEKARPNTPPTAKPPAGNP